MEQALYILNEKNYNKSLFQFQAVFLILKEKDCKYEGIFFEYSKINLRDDEGILDYTTIKLKTNSYYNYSNNINLKNDVLGFSVYDEDNINDKDFDKYDNQF